MAFASKLTISWIFAFLCEYQITHFLHSVLFCSSILLYYTHKEFVMLFCCNVTLEMHWIYQMTCDLVMTCDRMWSFTVNVVVVFYRGSSYHENDRVSSVAAELQFKSISRHSSPTEDRDGTYTYIHTVFGPNLTSTIPLTFCALSPEPSYPREVQHPSAARRSWELRTCINQSKGETGLYYMNHESSE